MLGVLEWLLIIFLFIRIYSIFGTRLGNDFMNHPSQLNYIMKTVVLYLTVLILILLTDTVIAQTPNLVHAGSATDGLSDPFSVQVSGDYAYVASRDSDALVIFDIRDSANPIQISSISDGEGDPGFTALLRLPVSVYVSGDYAYVASSSGALEIIDISDPANPLHAGSISSGQGDPDFPVSLYEPVSVHVSGNYAYVTSIGDGNDLSSTLEIFDISTPTTPVLVGEFSNILIPGAPAEPLDNPTSSFVSGDYVYVTNSGSPSFIAIYDISDPTNSSFFNSIFDGSGTTGSMVSLLDPSSIYILNDYIYAVGASSNTLEIIDISNPSIPVRAGGITTSVTPSSVYVSGDYAYVTSLAGNAIEVFNIRNLTNIVKVDEVIDGTSGALLSAPRSVYVSGDYAYVASSDSDALEIINIFQGPTVSITSDFVDFTNESLFEITIVFSEEVTGFEESDITINNGILENLQTMDNITFMADVSPETNGVVTVDIADDVAQDVVTNNNNSAATQFTIEYDDIQPTVEIGSTASNPTNMSPYPITIVFSEQVFAFVKANVLVDNGTLENIETANNIEYIADIIPTGEGTVVINIPAGVIEDQATNVSTSAQFSFEYDTVEPTVIGITSNASSPTNVSPIEVTISFSEEVAEFFESDILVNNGTVQNLQTIDNIIFTAEIIPDMGGMIIVNIPANTVQDLATNSNVEPFEFTIEYNSSEPTVNINSNVTDLTNEPSFEITITFSEEVVGLVETDISVDNGTLQNLQTTDSITFTADIIPAADGTVTVDVTRDVNGRIISSQFIIEYDNTNPTISITSHATNPTDASPFEITIVFSEEVIGFVDTDIIVDNGIVQNLQTEDNTTFTVEIIPENNGTVTVTIAANVTQDAGTNGNTASSQFTIEYDSSENEELPNLEVYNVVTPNGDNIHDYLKIENITFYPNNYVQVFTRSGQKVFEMEDYDNELRVFEGRSNIKSSDELSNGTYYYLIDDGVNKKRNTGFFTISK